MELIHPNQNHLTQMMSWFVDEVSLTTWGGPNFRFPFELDTFTEDLNLDNLSSFAMVNAAGDLVAFGQYYLRLERCHLGRLVVSPRFRHSGVGQMLLMQLIHHGKNHLKFDSSSLFVLPHNQKAIDSYKLFGFEFFDYPEKIPFEDCLYMVKAN